ncbi:NUDIX domain-containing protein [Candidatus Micrarchaeota archaeon]|nr:NUDIX domain-containing protein [Candidatus Micrarchaeota archaeon]MBU1930376.1 NUDIX domain-containing protein [Candidatus Micrarchaeota archaeon]
MNNLKVGVGVMIFKNGKILLAKRKNAHGAGEFAFPGGHLEFGESFKGCARRETREECGIEIQNIRFLFLANLKQYVGKHYCHVGLIADWKSGEPQTLEPEKSENWNWFSVDSLPKPLFNGCELSIEAFKTKKNFFDS